MRLAEEVDGAKERGELQADGRPKTVPDGNGFLKLTAADIGLSRKDKHEARQLRDAEAADPGVVRVRIRSRAFRRMGEILKQIDPNAGRGRPEKNKGGASPIFSRKSAAATSTARRKRFARAVSAPVRNRRRRRERGNLFALPRPAAAAIRSRAPVGRLSRDQRRGQEGRSLIRQDRDARQGD